MIISYRVSAWAFTILWTFLFTGDAASSAKYATGLHLLLSLDYFFHERAWLSTRWGLARDGSETRGRTLTRMATYRIQAWLITAALTFWITGNIGESLGFSALLHLLLSLDYYAHERMWLRIKWGLTLSPEAAKKEVLTDA